nr:hypothetical protein [Capnocytophaga leadbetteri]
MRNIARRLFFAYPSLILRSTFGVGISKVKVWWKNIALLVAIS